MVLVIRHTRSFSLEKGIGLFIATFLGVIFGMIIFIWWIIGTVSCLLFFSIQLIIKKNILLDLVDKIDIKS
jgi:uncharacterized membrane protein YgaE (UPF0421/DUF939 family)